VNAPWSTRVNNSKRTFENVATLARHSAREPMNCPTPSIAFTVPGRAPQAPTTTELLRDLAPKLARVIKAVLGASHPDVDDVLQKTLIALVHALPAYRGDGHILGYARVIAVRTAIAARTRSRRDRTRAEADIDGVQIATADATPGERAASKERARILRDLLAELPPEQAEALALRIVLGCSLEEVATQTGVPINTVRSRVRLAKERLKTRIESDDALRDALATDA
jgi:RNA polymerase sigma factor (sigma-70 family)